MFNELTILGVRINEDGVSPDPLKLTGGSMLRASRTTKECKRIYDLRSYFRKFIRNLPKLIRVALTMMEYDIDGIHHVSGIKHHMTDCLSRFPTVDYTPDDDEIQEFPLLVIPTIDFAASQHSDPACLEIITGLTNPALSRLHVNNVLKDEVLYYRPCF
jgi:hypothetical protein